MCNINTAEVAYRRKAMWFGIGVSVALFGLLLIGDVVWWLSVIILFVPVFIGAINFLQVRNRFCVNYGGSGMQNADEGSQSAHEVADETAKNADKAKSRTMNLQALGMTLVVLAAAAVVFYVA
jgi:hypothetical protein